MLFHGQTHVVEAPFTLVSCFLLEASLRGHGIMMGILYDMYLPKNIDMLGMESGAIAGETKWMADPT